MSALLDVLSAQERVVSELSKEIVRLRAENDTLRNENDRLRGLLGRTVQEASDHVMARYAGQIRKDGDA